MNKDAMKQILDAMRLHTAETHPLVETERAMELIETELAEPQTMRPAELAERLKQGEKWALTAQQQDPVATENELSNGLAMALHDAVLIRIGGKDDATKQACARIDKMVEKYRKGQP